MKHSIVRKSETGTAALLDAFPHKRERESRISREHAETPIYRELQLALDRLPDYFVRTAGEIVELEDTGSRAIPVRLALA